MAKFVIKKFFLTISLNINIIQHWTDGNKHLKNYNRFKKKKIPLCSLLIRATFLIMSILFLPNIKDEEKNYRLFKLELNIIKNK